jgi:hypothetical protein
MEDEHEKTEQDQVSNNEDDNKKGAIGAPFITFY